MKMIKFMGLKLALGKRQELLTAAKAMLTGNQGQRIATINPEFILEARHNEAFEHCLNLADLPVIDGVGLVITAAIKGRQLERLSGADLVPELLSEAERLKLKVLIVNWQSGLSDDQDIKTACMKRWPQLNLAVIDSLRDDLPLEAIQAEQAQLVLVGLGAPWQEFAAETIRQSITGVKLVLGVGGSFDFITGKLKRAPISWRRLGLEWLWRLVQQPKRLGRIYNAIFGFGAAFVRYEIINRNFYRPNVVGFLYNQQGEVLIVNSAKEPPRDFWKLPQGGVEPREAKDVAIKREMMEELGTADFNIKARFDDIYEYLWPEGYSIDGYKGQRQTLFLLEYTGQAHQIHLNAENKDYAWVKIDQLLPAVDEVVHRAYEIYLQKFEETVKL